MNVFSVRLTAAIFGLLLCVPTLPVRADGTAAPDISGVASPEVSAPVEQTQSPYGAAAFNGQLTSGLHYIGIHEPSPAVFAQLWFRAPAIGFGPQPVPSLSRLAVQAAAASRDVDGSSLSSYVASVGGQLEITVHPDAAQLSIIVPSFAAPLMLSRLGSAYFHPHLTDDAVHQAVSDLADEGLSDRFDPAVVLRNDVFALLFPSGAAHYPEIDAQALQHISLEQLTTFVATALRPANATLVLTGDVDPTLLTQLALPLRGVLPPASPDAATHEDTLQPRVTTARVDNIDADMPSAISASSLAQASPAPTLGVSILPPSTGDDLIDSKPVTSFTTKTLPWLEPGLGYAWTGPNIHEEQDSAAMDFLADYLFRPGIGTLAKQLAVSHPQLRVLGHFITYDQPGVLFVAISGDDAQMVTQDVEQGVASMARPLNEADFAAAKARFLAHLEIDFDTPDDLAASLGWYAVYGNALFAPGVDGEQGEYYQVASHLTPEAVAAAAKRYLLSPAVRVTLTAATSGKPT